MANKSHIQAWYENMWEAGHSKEIIKREFYINFHDNNLSEISHYINPEISNKKKLIGIFFGGLVCAICLDLFVGLIIKAIFDNPLNTLFRIPTFIILVLGVIGIIKILQRSSVGYSLIIIMNLLLLIMVNLYRFFLPNLPPDYLIIDFSVMANPNLIYGLTILLIIIALHLKLKTNPDAKLFGYKKVP